MNNLTEDEARENSCPLGGNCLASKCGKWEWKIKKFVSTCHEVGIYSPFDKLDGKRFVQCAASALGLALVIADPAADGGEGIRLHHDLVGVVKSFCANKRHVLRNIHPDRTHVLTWRFKESRTDAG